MASARARLKAVYSMAELAEMSGLTKKQIRGLLDANGVTVDRSQPKKHKVYLSALRRGLPDLWDSILDRESCGDVS